MGTARLKLPFLVPGQAQKELFHNEALQIIDMLVQPVVASVGLRQPEGAHAVGTMHVVGLDPVGAWAGHPNALAALTEGGWRFVTPVDQMTVVRADTGVPIRFERGQWIEGRVAARAIQVEGKQVVGAQGSSIDNPVGGTVKDIEVRQAVDLILAALRQHGLIQS